MIRNMRYLRESEQLLDYISIRQTIEPSVEIHQVTGLQQNHFVLRLTIGISASKSAFPFEGIYEGDDIEIEIDPRHYEKFKELLKNKFLPRLINHMVNNDVEEAVQQLADQCCK